MSGSQIIPREQFLMIATNLLYKSFLEPSRTRTKTLFKELQAGKVIPLTTVRMEDQSTVRFDASLDISEYHGKINFSAFRASVATLVNNLGEAVRAKRDVKVFTAENDETAMIFGITAITQEKGEPNVMVLSANTASGQPQVMLRLMYLNRDQFTEPSA